MPLPRILSLYLLHRHRVEVEQRRIACCATRWTAAIAETGRGAVFAFDSWYRDYGEPSLLQLLDKWQRERDFPAACNPEFAVD